MSRYEIIRDILKDIVIPIILGVCSICVAIAANSIAKSSNETAQLQALIAKNAEAPTIELVHSPGGYQDEASISISILDGKYSNFQTTTESFLSFVFSGFDENDHWRVFNRVDIPIDYFNHGHGSQAMYGSIWEWGSSTTTEVEQFRDSCTNYYIEKQNITPGTIYESELRVSVITCIKCTYLNLLEEEESVYYVIGPTGRVSQINQEQGAAWFQKHEDMQKDSFFIYSDWMRENNVEAAFYMIEQINETGEQYLETDDLLIR